MLDTPTSRRRCHRFTMHSDGTLVVRRTWGGRWVMYRCSSYYLSTPTFFDGEGDALTAAALWL